MDVSTASYHYLVDTAGTASCTLASRSSNPSSARTSKTGTGVSAICHDCHDREPWCSRQKYMLTPSQQRDGMLMRKSNQLALHCISLSEDWSLLGVPASWGICLSELSYEANSSAKQSVQCYSTAGPDGQG